MKLTACPLHDLQWPHEVCVAADADAYVQYLTDSYTPQTVAMVAADLSMHSGGSCCPASSYRRELMAAAFRRIGR